jgi:hypothetical protein
MTREHRRCCDGEIKGIRTLIEKNTETNIRMALDIQKLTSLQSSYIEQIKDTKELTNKHIKKIAIIELKQSIITYVSGGALLAVFAASSRYIFSHLKGH